MPNTIGHPARLNLIALLLALTLPGPLGAVRWPL